MLSRDQELFRAIFEQAGIGMAISDLEGKVLACNPALCRMLGYTEKEIVGADPEAFLHEEDQVDARPLFRELRAGKRDTYQVERRYRHKEGEVVCVRVTISLARSAAGKPEFAIGTLEDVTERVRSAAALEERETRLRLLTDQIPAIVWTVDRDLRFTSSTGSGLKPLGLGPGEVVGCTLQEFFGTEEADFLPLRAHRRAIRGEPATYEIEWRQHVYRVYVEPLRDAEDAVTGAIGIALDITGQKHAEAALGQSEEMRRAITESCPDYVMVLDLKARILFINRTVPDLTVEGVLGTPVYDYVPQECRPAMRACFDRVIATGRPDGYEVRYVSRDGKTSFFESRVWPVTREGEVYSLTVYSRDVTQRQLLEEQLHHSQKMESVGRLAGGVAHDLNNQLSVILGSAEIARLHVSVPARVAPELDRISAAGQKAAALTRQLLAFGRRQVLQPRVLDLNELVAGIREILGRVIGEDIELLFDLGEGLPRVRVDPTQIEQVILNLAINARDAMPKGGRLTLRTEGVELGAEPPGDIRPGRHLLLTVEDTGTGMDAETLARAFEPFFTTKEVGKGTGLGLSVVHGIVTQSGGHVFAESEPDRGSTFHVLLPAAQGAAEPPPPEPRAADPRGTETVLLVEDEEFVRVVTKGILEENGYRVLAAAGGEEALALCREHEGEIHLVLSDVVMPGRNGYETARALTRLRPGLKVVLVSGYAEDPEEAGRHVFLQKPVAPALLLRTIRDVLDGAPVSGPRPPG